MFVGVGPCVVVYASVFGRCVDVVVCSVVDVGAGPHQQVSRAWVLGGWRSSWGLVLIAITCTQNLTRSRTLA